MLDTVDNVKERLGITSIDYDDFLTLQVGIVSDAINGYCGRIFEQKTYDQTFYREDYCPSREIELFHYPVISVTSITEDTVVRNSSTYRVYKPGGLIIAPYGNVDFFCASSTVVRYVAGYATIPPLVLSVLDSIVQERYNKKSSGVDLNFGSDVQRISVPGAIAIDFDYTLNNNERKSAYGVILGSNLNVLDAFRSDRAVMGDDDMSYIEEVP